MKIFHNKETEQINFADERFYLCEGEYYPSVTSILDAYPKGYGFIQWLKDLGNNADEVLKRAGESGSRIHNAIEQYLKGIPVMWVDEEKQNYDLDEWRQILKFVEFWTTVKPELIQSEFQMCSPKLGFGGTIDLICRINWKIWLIDVKSSNALYKTHELQLSAYSTMWNEQNKNLQIDQHGIFHTKALTRGIDKTGKKIQGEGWQLKEFERSYRDSFKIFQHIHEIWKEENPNPRPKNLTYPDRILLGKTELIS